MNTFDYEKWLFIVSTTVFLMWLLFRWGILSWPEFDPFELQEFYGTPEQIAQVRSNNGLTFDKFGLFAAFCEAHYPDVDLDDYQEDWQEAVLNTPPGKQVIFVVTADGNAVLPN